MNECNCIQDERIRDLKTRVDKLEERTDTMKDDLKDIKDFQLKLQDFQLKLLWAIISSAGISIVTLATIILKMKGMA